MPHTGSVSRYIGCPIPDTDGDGINDEEDKCPLQKGLVKYMGCPIPDTDGDGVNDEEDKCPAVSGSKTNQGCPEIKNYIVKKVNYAASAFIVCNRQSANIAKIICFSKPDSEHIKN
ncbi:MAG: thrombospondin type 3 repeat-containing protein [Ferruginibacter sp.]